MTSLLKKIFPAAAPPKTPEELAKEWRQQLRAEVRTIDRQIRRIQREEQKVKAEAKKAAKADEISAVRSLAKEILHSRKAVNRLRTTQTTLNSLSMQIQQQVSQLKVAGGLQRSASIMTQMNQLCKVNAISATMQEMSREMTKAGLIEEMMSDALDNALDDDIEEEELDSEVAAVVQEVMKAKLKDTQVGDSELPEEATAEPEEAEDNNEEDAELEAKFAALKRAV